MVRVSFVISNNRHHPAMILPVVRQLTERHEARCQVLSLCELRGQASPKREIEELGVCWKRVVPANLRKGLLANGVSASKRRPSGHGRLRKLLWRVFLARRMAGLLSPAPDLAVLPNDAAYPYDRLVKLLAKLEVPFLLVQEGIRFELPDVPPSEAYGSGGAAAIAAWGESSAVYFRNIGVAPERIRQTGSPRFDVIAGREEKSEHVPPIEPPGGRKLLLLTNPVDALGLCSATDKTELVRRFLSDLAPLLASRELLLTLKLHPGESLAEYEHALRESQTRELVALADSRPLYDLFREADAAVIMASTAGLEALLFGLKLGVLELPGSGFAFDYVEREAAKGINLSAPVAPQVLDLLDYDAPGVEDYLRTHLARTSGATEAVGRLVMELSTKQSTSGYR